MSYQSEHQPTDPLSEPFLADRNNCSAYATVLRLSSSSVTLCIVAKRYVLSKRYY